MTSGPYLFVVPIVFVVPSGPKELIVPIVFVVFTLGILGDNLPINTH